MRRRRIGRKRGSRYIADDCRKTSPCGNFAYCDRKMHTHAHPEIALSLSLLRLHTTNNSCGTFFRFFRALLSQPQQEAKLFASNFKGNLPRGFFCAIDHFPKKHFSSSHPSDGAPSLDPRVSSGLPGLAPRIPGSLLHKS